MVRQLRLPAIVPTSAGGAQVEWHDAGIDLEIECYPDGRIEVAIDDIQNGLEWEGALEEATDRLKTAIAKLS